MNLIRPIIKIAAIPLVCLLLTTSISVAQEIRIHYINTDNYPIVEAGFTAYTKEKTKIYNSTVKDFRIAEYNTDNQILEVTNPELDYQPVSIVFMIDISLSMSGARTNLVREGLADFVDQIPLESSEIAMASFSDETYVYTDFTQNRNRIALALNSLQTINGTDFNKAFLDADQGALALSTKSQNKKVIIFVTDGLGDTNDQKITDLAKSMNATVFTLNVYLDLQEDLKRLTTNTGGLYFEKIKTIAQFRSASQEIFKKLKCTDFGTVKWMSNPDCNPSREVSLEYRKQAISFNYNVPSGKVGKIEVNPSQILFGTGKPGTEQLQKLNITTRNIPVTLTEINIGSASAFTISDTLNFPYQFKTDEQLALNVKFKAPDAGIFNNKMKISFKECPDIYVNLQAGGEEQIKLLFPLGGEVFNVENDTTVLWEGVKKSQNVLVSFRLHKQDEWKPLGKASNLRYKWNIPIDTSKDASIKLTPLPSADENMEITATLDAGKSQLKSLFFNPGGDRLITTDKDAFVKTWDTENGVTIKSLGGYQAEKAFINPLNQMLMMFLKDETVIWNLEEDKQANRILNMSKKVSTSFILPDGDERAIAGLVSADQAKNIRIWSVLTPSKVFLINQPDIKWGSYTWDGKYAVALGSKNNIKIIHADSAKVIRQISLKDEIREIIMSPAEYIAVVRTPGGICIIDLASGAEMFRLPGYDYKQFTPGGKFVLIKPTDSSKPMLLADIRTGKTMLAMDRTRTFKFSDNSEYLMINKQDTLKLYHLADNKLIMNLPRKNANEISFNHEATKVFVITSANTLEIYETSTGNLLGSINEFSRKVRGFALNPVKQQFAVLTEDNRVEIWSEGKTREMKDAVSGEFRIVAPKPVVADTIQFGEQLVNQPTDLNIEKFITNPTPFSIFVRRINIGGKDASMFDISDKDFPRKIEAKTQDAEEFRFIPENTRTFEAVAWTCTATDTFKTVLLGKGVTTSVKLLLKYLDFGPLKVGTTKDTLASLLVNQGTDTLRIPGLKNFGPDQTQFTILINKTIKLAPGDTLKLPIRFSPVWRGKTSTLLIPEQIPFNEKIIVRGEGLAPRELWLKGVTKNGNDSLPISARVVCIDLEAHRKMLDINTENDGKFLLKLNADRNYGVLAEKENFISTSLNIGANKDLSSDTLYREIYLTEIKPGAIIRLNCIFFEVGKANLLPESELDLQRMVEIIKSNPGRYFEIHGHTDSKGDEAYNMNLSKARATSVMNYLVKQGAAKEKLSIRFFGESKPVASNDTEEGRSLNRRVEMKVVR